MKPYALVLILLFPAISSAQARLMGFGTVRNTAPAPAPVQVERTQKADREKPPTINMFKSEEKTEPSPGPAPTPKPAPSKIGADTNLFSVTARTGLTLRTSPSKRASSLGTIKNGGIVTPTGRERGDFVEVEIAGKTGWVLEEYLTEASAQDLKGCQTCRSGGLIGAAEDIGRFFSRGPLGHQSALPYADRIQANVKAGRNMPRKNLCWRAVWTILQRAGLVKGDLSVRGAKDALVDLAPQGFRHDPSACQKPGVVRVYGASLVEVPRRKRTDGDTFGHIEILGTDRKYHHFTSSRGSIQTRFGEDRRPLTHCLVKY